MQHLTGFPAERRVCLGSRGAGAEVNQTHAAPRTSWLRPAAPVLRARKLREKYFLINTRASRAPRGQLRRWQRGRKSKSASAGHVFGREEARGVDGLSPEGGSEELHQTHSELVGEENDTKLRPREKK